jgi:formate-dependent nitrite reductase cytochrome c552 subunit
VSFFDYPTEQSAEQPPLRLLAGATDEEWAEVLKHTHHRQFRPGEVVVADGGIAVPAGGVAARLLGGARGR